MHADDHYIVFFKDMSMQITGVTQTEIEAFWDTISNPALSRAEPSVDRTSEMPVPPFTREHILEFAVGSPSKAFGPPYAVFDQDRRIARLPGPPYCFMDKVTEIAHPQWELAPSGWIEAQYDIPPDAWYFEADRTGSMPFCVLLEIALQPCGWLAAFAGSALKSKNDLKFRNLGGEAVVYANIVPGSGTLTMRSRITKVSEAADMIIEHFDFEVLQNGKPVYMGNTYFGFFTAQALAQQIGLRDSVYTPTEAELQLIRKMPLPDEPPLTPNAAAQAVIYSGAGLDMPATALRMIDGIDLYIESGGANGLGFIRGYKAVDPEEWFFDAHFYQDPVCPGSLGVESFLQLIKYAALQRWPHLAHSHRFETICERSHRWSYRGQVIPTNAMVQVEASIVRIEDGPEPVIMADGVLHVDGISIYKMEGFGLRLVKIGAVSNVA
jgi:3-hydroxymyristoyl/3-hydroxydecanoyl-(acyl carrier protein) dehydratase